MAVGKSSVAKRSMVVGGHKTNVSSEEAFWSGIKDIAGAPNITMSDLVSEIDLKRNQGNPICTPPLKMREDDLEPVTGHLVV